MAKRRMFLVPLLSLILAACGGNGDDEAGEYSSRSAESSETAPPPTTAGRGSSDGAGGNDGLSAAERAKVQEMVDDTEAAVRITNMFWAQHWSDFFTGTYRSPSVKGGYFGSESPACGGQQPDGAGNAYYCPSEDYLAWDWQLFASQFQDEKIGDSFVYFVIAHEWAHAIQERLDRSIVSVASELQADCLAAATFVGAEADGTLVIEPGDRGEIFQSLTNVADEYEWGDPSAHGSADERIEAYQTGERGGVRACLAS